MSGKPAQVDDATGLVWTDLPACPICGCAERRPFERFAVTTEHGYVQCRGCSVVYLSPRPVYDEKYLALAYGGGPPRDSRSDRKGCGRDGRKFINRGIDLMNCVERFLPAKGTLLDVGCSVGHLLGVARDRGWRVTGVDVSDGAIGECRRKGFEVYREDITATPPERRYDVVTACHVLEHTANPVDFLSAVRDRVNDGGLVVVEVPDIDEPGDRLRRWLARRGLKRPRVTGMAHLFEFTRSAFIRAADGAGLRTVATHTYGHDYRRSWLSEARRKVLTRFLLGSKFRFFLRRRSLHDRGPARPRGPVSVSD